MQIPNSAFILQDSLLACQKLGYSSLTGPLSFSKAHEQISVCFPAAQPLAICWYCQSPWPCWQQQGNMQEHQHENML